MPPAGGSAASGGETRIVVEAVPPPPGIDAGTVWRSFAYQDAGGTHLLVLSRDLSSEEDDAGPVERATLSISHYDEHAPGQGYAERWTTRETVECDGLDFEAAFIEDAIAIEDFDGDGRAETLVGIATFCGGGVDPHDIALVLHGGGRDFVLRGESLVQPPDGAPAFGGDHAIEAAPEGVPTAFVQALEQTWTTVRTYPRQAGAATAPGSQPSPAVSIPGTEGGCAFAHSPVDFCDDTHLQHYRQALAQRSADFNHDYLVVAVPTRPEYGQYSLAAVDTRTGIVVPVPIDAYSGPPGAGGESTGPGRLDYRIDGDELCIDGTTLAYRVLRNGRFCFRLQDGRFTGDRDEYTG